jgi:tetratricopeptide (TPR) repeat protein
MRLRSTARPAARPLAPVFSTCLQAACVAAGLLLAGCVTPPQQDSTALQAATPSLEQMLSDAALQKQQGSVERERDAYRAAARAYPTRKEPWQRLAESYFDAGDYGNAILAAQEVVQRDAADPVAQGVLAVSGLRVSSQALGELRARTGMTTDTRKQAEEVVKTLREMLGESVLVPKPEVTNAPAPARRTQRAKATTGAAAKPAAGASAPAATAADAPAVKPSPSPSAAAPAAAAPASRPATASKPSNPFATLR